MSVEKQIDELVLSYLKRAEGRTAIMSPQDIAKIVRDAAHQGAMMGYNAGMKMARHSHNKELEIAELSVKELTERVRQLELELIASQQ
jgi:hypothetical protein